MGPSVPVAYELQPGGTTMKNSLLPVGDQQTMLLKALESAGFLAFDLSKAGRDWVRLQQLCDAVNLLDIRTPRLRGLRSAAFESAELIVVTHGSIAEALAAMRLGAGEIRAVPLTCAAVCDRSSCPSDRVGQKSARRNI
jgi:DNA-binding NtrC family response regulator